MSIARKLAFFICPELIDERSSLERAANFDALTGLPNRRAFELAEQSALETRQAFVYFDFNNFKKVNDSAGHDAGDEVLKEFSAVFASVARAYKCRAFRVGGDEFVFICDPRFAEKVRDSAEQRIGVRKFGNVPVSVSGAVGRSATEADRLLPARKTAMKTVLEGAI